MCMCTHTALACEIKKYKFTSSDTSWFVRFAPPKAVAYLINYHFNCYHYYAYEGAACLCRAVLPPDQQKTCMYSLLSPTVVHVIRLDVSGANNKNDCRTICSYLNSCVMWRWSEKNTNKAKCQYLQTAKSSGKYMNDGYADSAGDDFGGFRCTQGEFLYQERGPCSHKRNYTHTRFSLTTSSFHWLHFLFSFHFRVRVVSGRQPSRSRDVHRKRRAEELSVRRSLRRQARRRRGNCLGEPRQHHQCCAPSESTAYYLSVYICTQYALTDVWACTVTVLSDAMCARCP